MRQKIVIIGAGMAGLSCAQMLAAAGQTPLILDKGRGLGGRMATRRASVDGTDMRFDHGAQYISARSPDFAAYLSQIPEAVAVWDDGADRVHHVGLPGMSGLARAMAAGLDVRQGVEVTALEHEAAGWRLATGSESINAARVIVTVPAPQAMTLIGGGHALAAAVNTASMAPCLTLMAAFPPDAPRPFVSRTAADQPLSWIAQDSTKPGRAGPGVTWVAQAGSEWSSRHLEEDRDAIAARMLPLLCAEIGADPGDALYVAAHRWRYARVTEAVGRPFLRSDDTSLYLGGDWCLGPRVEAAWLSGRAIAQDILDADTAA
ncbi:MAG: FAD-dependent oxidoreductase [Jannaschia sp.]